MLLAHAGGLAAVALWPLARTVWFSFTDATFSICGARFIGLDNFAPAGRSRMVAIP
jgi:ABC-type sugar transport system permease subunit